MTSPSSTRAGSKPPGDRPHLPPVPTTSRRTDRKAPLAWLPWVLLGLLLLTLLAAALLMKAADGDSGSSRTASQSAGQSQDTTAESGGAAGGSTDAAASGAALTAGGRDLLALPGGDVGAVVGETVEGTATVQSVVADEGFWVGPSASNRVFVFLTPEARRSAGESGFQVEEGQTVQLAGSVKAASAEFAQTAGVTDAEGADQMVRQGGYVEATQVQLAD